jgi:beta-aspartyl-peptidase (threonine type)
MNSATRLALTLLTATVLAASLCGHPALAEGDTRVAIAIHGGAGTITREELSEEREKAIRETLARALQAGHARLTDGMTAMDAVEAAIVVLEDSPLFRFLTVRVAMSLMPP